MIKIPFPKISFLERSIRNKLITIFLAAVLVPLALTGIYTHYKAEAVLTDKLSNTSTVLLHTADEMLNEYLNTVAVQTKTLGDNVNLKLMFTDPGQRTHAEDYIINVFKSYKANNSSISSVYYGTFDKKMYVDTGEKELPNYDPTARDWYKLAESNPDKVLWIDPYVDKLTGKQVISAVKAVKVNGKVVGVLGVDVTTDALNAKLSSIKVGKTGYIYMTTKDGTIMSHPESNLIGTNLAKDPNGFWSKIGGKDSGFIQYNFNGEDKYAVFFTDKISGWKLVSPMDKAELTDDVSVIRNAIITAIFISFLLAVLVAFYFAKSITKPLNEVKEQFVLIEDGIWTNKIDTDRKDEFGDVFNSLDKMTTTVGNLIKEVSTMSDNVAAAAEELSASSQQSAAASTQVARTIADVANGSEEQLASVEETSAVIEQITAGIQQTSSNAESVAQMADKTAKMAEDGGKVISSAVHKMNDAETTVEETAKAVIKLGERSKEIGAIVETISGIAAQTNLLALNAAIEAARAGEAGRGFAVVAEEVRKLAEQSADATKHIAELIAVIQQETDSAVVSMETGTTAVKEGTDVVDHAGETFKDILGHVEKMVASVKEISTATREIAVGSEQVVKSVETIDTISKDIAGQAQTVSAATEEQTAAVEEIAASSQSLATLAEELKATLAKFSV